MGSNQKFQNQDTTSFRKTRNLVFSLIVHFLKHSKSSRRRAVLLGERAEWVTWLQDHFEEYEFYWTRESLWNVLIDELSETQEWTALEFGVAWGYTSHYWLSRCDGALTSWHGFDRFTGLPRSWRDLNQSTFNANGVPPQIEDSRVVWHVGDVENELPKATIVPTRKLVLFDLDLYEPTAFAWNYLAPYLTTGDLLYFDEGFDNDERRVINEFVFSTFSVSIVGATHTAIAFRINERLTSA